MTKKVHHQTRKATDKALEEGTITEQSHAAVLAGEMSLQEARNIGMDEGPSDTPKGYSGQDETRIGPRSTSVEDREGGTDTPPQPVSRISKDDRTPTKTPCLCGCGLEVSRTFAAGHDARMFRVAREHLTEGRELSDEQREYLERSGKLERVRARLAEEGARRREIETRKTARKGSR